MSELITPAEALHEAVTDLIEVSECSLFEVVGVLEVVKSELTLESLAADEDESDDFASEEVVGEFESDGVVGE
jgi:hypothetical protein